MYGSMTTARHADRLVGDPRREDLLLDRELEAGVDRQAEVRRRACRGLNDRPASGIGLAGDVALGEHACRGVPASSVLVVLLDAVLADALAVDEAEELRRERRVRGAARLRVDPDRLGLERQPARPPSAGDPRPDLVGRRRRRGRGPGRRTAAPCSSTLSVSAAASSPSRPRIATRLAATSRARPGVSWSARPRRALALDGRRQDDRPGPVVDRRRAGSGSSTWTVVWARPGRQAVALDDLPVDEAAARATPPTTRNDQRGRRARRRRESVRPSIGPSHVGRSLAGRHDERARRAGRARGRSPACGSPARGRAG